MQERRPQQQQRLSSRDDAFSETIVPALVSAAPPIVAGDQIVFVLGNYRGDIWMPDLQASR